MLPDALMSLGLDARELTSKDIVTVLRASRAMHSVSRGSAVLDRLDEQRSRVASVEADGHRSGHDKEAVGGAHRMGGVERR